MQETYLSGLNDDEEVPFRFERAATAARHRETAPGVRGPKARTAQAADVIDIQGMIGELEASSRARGRE